MKKNQKVNKTKKQLNLPKIISVQTKTPPVKKIKNAPEYYLCMGDNCHGQNITQVAKKCKSDAPV